jgi:dienelactone hydrolase
MRSRLLVIAVVLLGQACATSDPVLTASGTPSEVFVSYYPAKVQPAPTVLVAHGCDGVSDHHTSWATVLNSWGYNAAVVNSFRARGISTVCDRGGLVSPSQRAADLVLVALDVRGKPWHSGKIGAIGFSHGGSTMLALSERGRYQAWASDFLPENASIPIHAVISYYPGCVSAGAPLRPDMPVMIHFAMQDDWTPPSSCGWSSGSAQFADQRYAVHAYPNATHAFDRLGPPRKFLNYFLAYDPDADRLSRQRTRDFFDRFLR